MTRWVDVGDLAELEFNPGATVKVGGEWIALFKTADGYRAMDNPCPHAGAPLADGSVLDGKVVCFLHCWEFDLETGKCDVGDEWNVRVYPVRERAGRLEIEVPPAADGLTE